MSKAFSMCVILFALIAAPLSGASGVAKQFNGNPLNVDMERRHAASFIPGVPLEIIVIIDGASEETPGALGVEEHLPEGWWFESSRGHTNEPPAILPAPGDGPLLEFAWITPPRFPCIFVYTVMIPESEGGAREIRGRAIYRLFDGAYQSPPAISRVMGPEQKPPTLELLGANPMTLRHDAVWREPGYVALDHTGMDISRFVEVSGVVDTSREGDYALAYSVAVEETGLSAREIRQVRVIPSRPGRGGNGADTERERNTSGEEIIAPWPNTPDGSADEPISEEVLTPPIGQNTGSREAGETVAGGSAEDASGASGGHGSETPVTGQSGGTGEDAPGQGSGKRQPFFMPDLSAYRPAQGQDEAAGGEASGIESAQPELQPASPVIAGEGDAGVSLVKHEGSVAKTPADGKNAGSKSGNAVAHAVDGEEGVVDKTHLRHRRTPPAPSVSSAQGVRWVLCACAVGAGLMAVIGAFMAQTKPGRRRPRQHE